MPSSARLMMAAPPATIDMPSVCMNRNIGNAHREPDSLMKVLNESCSIQRSTSNMAVYRSFPRSLRASDRSMRYPTTPVTPMMTITATSTTPASDTPCNGMNDLVSESAAQERQHAAPEHHTHPEEQC